MDTINAHFSSLNSIFYEYSRWGGEQGAIVASSTDVHATRVAPIMEWAIT